MLNQMVLSMVAGFLDASKSIEPLAPGFQLLIKQILSAIVFSKER